MRQPGDQINVDVFNPGRAQSRNIIEHRGAPVQTPYGRSFRIHVRLHSQAYAVYSATPEELEHHGGERSWRAFDGNFGIALESEILRNRDK